MASRKEYFKKYHKKNYKRIRQQKTDWARSKRDRERLVKIKGIVFNELSPILKNIKPKESKKVGKSTNNK